jgi:hypothetical protein
LAGLRCPRFSGEQLQLTAFGGGGGNRTRVRKYSAFGSTCLADSISLINCYPTGRENN